MVTIDNLEGKGTGRITGGAEFAASFGPGRYQAFVCATFKGEGYELGKPTEHGIWLNNYPTTGTTSSAQVYMGECLMVPTALLISIDPSPGFQPELGGIFTFKTNPTSEITSILARVGVSFISAAQACKNAEEEIPDYDFGRVHKEARESWNELLGRVQVDPTGVEEDTVELFYSSVGGFSGAGRTTG